MGLKSLPELFNVVVCNPCQSSPSLTILVPLWFIIMSLVISHLCKALFSGFRQFKGKFVDDQNTSKYRDRAPLTKELLYRRLYGSFQRGKDLKISKFQLVFCYS